MCVYVCVCVCVCVHVCVHTCMCVHPCACAHMKTFIEKVDKFDKLMLLIFCYILNKN